MSQRASRYFGRIAAVAGASALTLYFCVALTWQMVQRTRSLDALLDNRSCAPLSVLDREGRPLRELPSSCALTPRGHFTPLSQVPARLLQLVRAAEDRRFESHRGVDGRAVLRALWSNLRAGRVVSGASTLSMQLARMLRAAPRTRSLHDKLWQVWDALWLERRLDKPQILEAYLHLAYYGAGAYGVGDAAHSYFGRPLPQLSEAELALLAVLPRAPSAYDLRRHPERALSRRRELLTQLAQRAELSKEHADTLAAEPLALVAPRPRWPARAGHFVDWVIGELPEAERRTGGTLNTTLDLALQEALEPLLRQHVQQLSAAGVTQAGLVVLDSRTGEVRALLGSVDYASSQLNSVTRRRQLGSLLKPFVYALALEAGDSPESLALDVGDVPSQYRARDWVGREAGPLSYREALAGSYNLAAVHVLERTSVAQLHQRLRRAGVAELSAPPAHYGLPLALGSARVRLLDVAAGYGFMVRDGAVRRATAVRSLVRADASVYRPEPVRDAQLFTSEVSRQVLDILSDPAARRRRFGRGLPLDHPEQAPVALKTGTASGMSDVSAVLVSSQLTVAAWSGRFDGAPTRGMSGMWGALPLAQRALMTALRGESPELPATPASLHTAADDLLSHGLEHQPELGPWAERARVRAVTR